MGAQATDVVIVGMGPAGIFCALSLLEHGHAGHIVMVDKGLSVRERRCPKRLRGPSGACVGCEPCRITAGFSGAGAIRRSLAFRRVGETASSSASMWRRPPSSRWTASTCRSVRTRTWRGWAARSSWPTYAAAPSRPASSWSTAPYATWAPNVRATCTRASKSIWWRPAWSWRFSTTCTQVLVEGNTCVGVALEGPHGAGELRARHTVVAHGQAGRRLAGEAVRGARHRPRSRHGGHRRSGGSAQRDHGDGQPGALRVQAGGLSQALQEQGPHLLPEPRRFRQPGELRQRPGSGERPLL